MAKETSKPNSIRNTLNDIETNISDVSENTNVDSNYDTWNGLETINNSSFSLDKHSYRGSHQIENVKSTVDLDTNENVKIYRAVPVNELNNGDWVTTDKTYAKNVANENGGKVCEYEVKANQLYYPDNVKELPTLH